MRLLLLLAIAIAALTRSATAANLRFVREGIEINAGSMGTFTLEYPKLTDGSQKETHKLVDRSFTGGTAELKYEGGTRMTLSLGGDGRISAVLSDVPAGVKSVDLDLHIPISFNQGGKWKLGDKQGDFPVRKPAAPHLYQGHAPALEITNYEGKSLMLKAPEYSFLQLTDNREWNWDIFHWKAITPVDANRKTLEIAISTAGETARAKPLVDALGQSTQGEWPDKVKSAEELKQDLAAEQGDNQPSQRLAGDAFGGLTDSGRQLGLKATGFFHVEKHEGRWLLVDPQGNAFFHTGVCGFNPNDDYTLLKGREPAYAWIPPREGEFASAFKKDSGGTILSFHLANQIRKFGRPFHDEDYAARMIGRLRRWGFNSVGAFTALEFGREARKSANFPTVAHLPLNAWEGVARIPGIHETFDPFDEKTRATVAANLAKFLPEHANDPLIIGWFIVNEPIYEEIPRILPTLKGSRHACKRRFTRWLAEEYHDIATFNKAWKMDAKDFDALDDEPLAATTEAAKRDAERFAGVFLDEYLRLVKDNVRRHDSHHLLLGCRLQPGTISHEWICRALGRHLDVMSFNYYTYGIDHDLLRRVRAWTGDIPMMFSEFFWSSPTDSGLAGGREVGSQRERGLAYRNYVEQAAATGFVIGIEWFTLVDQSVTGRWFSGFDGERANTGLIAVTDRPWKAMLAEMLKTHDRLYDVWLGKTPPFVWTDARFNAAK